VLAAEAKFLGGSVASVDAVSKNQKWSAITRVRYRDNSLLVNSQETETNFRPTLLIFKPILLIMLQPNGNGVFWGIFLKINTTINR
jgi:hypothetical protein